MNVEMEMERMELWSKRKINTHIVGDEMACSALVVMEELSRLGCLREFKDAYFEFIHPGAPGNCHDVAMALMSDLIVADRAQGWIWATGFVGVKGAPFDHSWLEYEGWVVDASRNRCLFVPITEFYTAYKISTVTKRDARDSRRWIEHAFKQADRCGFLNFKSLFNNAGQAVATVVKHQPGQDQQE